MADWEYKEAIWTHPQRPNDGNVHGMGYVLEDGYPVKTGLPRSEYNNKDAVEDFYSRTNMDFTTWLGHHSRNGWEIFKISGRPDAQNARIWCVFRRLK